MQVFSVTSSTFSKWQTDNTLMMVISGCLLADYWIYCFGIFSAVLWTYQVLQSIPVDYPFLQIKFINAFPAKAACVLRCSLFPKELCRWVKPETLIFLELGLSWACMNNWSSSRASHGIFLASRKCFAIDVIWRHMGRESINWKSTCALDNVFRQLWCSYVK